MIAIPRRRWVVATVIGAIVVIAGGASADLFERNEDGSGNVLDFQENESVGDEAEVMEKFGAGVNGSPDTGIFVHEHPEFNIDGDASFTIVVENRADVFNNGDQATAVPFRIVGNDGTALHRLRITSDSDVSHELEYEFDGDPGLSCSITLDPSTAGDPFSLAIQRDIEGITGAEIQIEAWNAEGTRVDTNTCSNSLSTATSTTSPSTRLMDDPDGDPSAAWELRVWNQTVQFSTLRKIADPDRSQFTQTGQGDELGFYRLERINVGDSGDVQALNEIGTVINTNATVDRDGRLNLDAWFYDEQHDPVFPDGGVNASLARIDDESGEIQYWNDTADEWQTTRFRKELTGTEASGLVFEGSFTGVDGSQPIDVIVTGEFTDSEGDTYNATETETVEVDQVIEIAGLQASGLIELGVWGILFLFAMKFGLSGFAFVASAAAISPLLVETPVPYPGFRAFVVFAIVVMWLEYLARNNLLPTEGPENDEFNHSNRQGFDR